MKQMRWILIVFLLNNWPLLGWSQVKWFTPEVGKVIGIETVPGTSPTYPMQVYRVGKGQVAAITLALFDTVATFAQGRVVNRRTGKPVVSARIRATYRSLGVGCCQYKTVLTDEQGFFRLGWVGASGPAGGHSARRLQVEAVGYLAFDSQQVDFGGSAYLHIELATPK